MNRAAPLVAIVLASLTACTDPSGVEPQSESTTVVSQSLGNGTYMLVIPPAFGGTFSVQPVGTPCSVNCWTYPAGTVVTILQSGNNVGVFNNWTGDCSGWLDCTVTMNADHTVSGVFIPMFGLWFSQMTNGGVQFDPNIGPTKGGGGWAMRSGTIITLTPVPDPGATFTGWTGDCSGTGPCVLPMTQDHTVGATFTTATVNPTLSIVTTGAGTVTANPAPSCYGTLCSYPVGTTVTLTAVPAAGATFAGWSGACSGASTTCTVAMTTSRSVSATFQQSSYAVHIAPTTNGNIGVMAGAAGTPCGTGCVSYPAGTTVWLYANPVPGATFTGWQGDCAPVGTSTSCTLVMNQEHLVGALFSAAPTTHTLTVTNTYGGTTQGPTALCGSNATCTWTFPTGTPITLTFTPLHFNQKVWYSLIGVTGCTWDGASSCTLTLDQDQDVFVDWEYNGPYEVLN